MQRRVEAHILVAFLGYRLWVCLKQKLKVVAESITPARALESLRSILMVQVWFTFRDGGKRCRFRVPEAEKEQALLLHHLASQLPAQPEIAALKINHLCESLPSNCETEASTQPPRAIGIVALRALRPLTARRRTCGLLQDPKNSMPASETMLADCVCAAMPVHAPYDGPAQPTTNRGCTGASSAPKPRPRGTNSLQAGSGANVRVFEFFGATP